MKKCIWCSKDENLVKFIKKAHTIPQSLGGKQICEEVCDDCNHYFGSPKPNVPSVELVFKETFNISRHYLLHSINQHKKVTRYKSEFFNVNWERNSIAFKPKYSLKPHFQKTLGRQFKRAMFKVFLEDRARLKGDAHDAKFDFIRRFARFDLDDYPVFYFRPATGIIYFSSVDAIEPQIRFSNEHERIMKEFRFYEFWLMGHFFSLPTSSQYLLFKNQYIKYCRKEHSQIYSKIEEIERMEQIDFLFRYMEK